jgi:beta-lactamase regulating signal transducer with metallopeptidase domain
MVMAVLLAPVLASILLGLFARRIGTVLPPVVAVVGLTAAALVTALSAGFMLSALGVSAVAQFAPVARWGGWSAAALDATEPLPGVVLAAAGLLSAVLLLLAVRQVVRSIRELREASRACDELGGHADGLVIVDDEYADAYAISGFRTSRIVVSRPMLQALPPAERRVLLAHEAAHVRHRHHLFVQLADLAAAANPLLRSVSREVRIGVERWADEAAVAETGDRKVAARSLARAGLARMQSGAPTLSGALAGADGDISRRVSALLDERPRSRPVVTLALVALVAALVSTSAVTAQQTHERIAHADWVLDHR